MADTVFTVVSGCVEKLAAIIELVHKVKENNELCYQIIERAEILKQILENLRGQPQERLSSATRDAIRALEQHLDKCKMNMTKLDEGFLARPCRLFLSKSYHSELTKLYDELNGATTTLTATLSTTILDQIEELQQLIKQQNALIQQAVANPNAGVYQLASMTPSPRSAVVVTARAEVDSELQESFLVIKWEDTGSKEKEKIQHKKVRTFCSALGQTSSLPI